MASIFISYRRRDSGFASRFIAEQLKQRFGKHEVFLDVDKILPGDKWESEIRKHVGLCGVALVVIGENWFKVDLEASKPQGDFLRLEVAELLKRKEEIKIIPVLLAGTSMPDREQLPDELQEIVEIQGMVLRAEDGIDQGIDRLVDRIDAALGKSRQPIDRPTLVEKQLVVVSPETSHELHVDRLPDSDQYYNLSEELFFRGLKKLHEQIGNLGPDLFVGINYAGIMIAAYLGGSGGRLSRNRPFGIIKTGKNKGAETRTLPYVNLPTCDEVTTFCGGDRPLILVADSQHKSGYVGQQVIEFIQNKYAAAKPIIRYASLIVCGVTVPSPVPDSVSMKDLFNRVANDEAKHGIYNSLVRAEMKKLPDFVAYVSKGPVGMPNDIP